MRIHIILALVATIGALDNSGAAAEKIFRAGAAAVDITPEKFPVIVNGMFEERLADRAHDRLRARALVLDDGSTRLAVVVVDSCMMPRELIDRAKELARPTTGIPAERMLISATHTHSAPSVMGVLGSSSDEEYRKFLVPRIAQSIELAARSLAPARIGWGVIEDYEHTHNRRWITRPDRLLRNPFGELTVRANMHPGYQNPNFIGPSGPVDPDISLLAVQSREGRPVALLANYSMHYFGSPIVSSDYFGRFAETIGARIGAKPELQPFVAIMSQGTSGDLMWMDYGRPRSSIDLNSYADAVAAVAAEGYRNIKYHDWVPLAMAEAMLTLRRRLREGQRVAWARPIYEAMEGRAPRGRPQIYAREQILLDQDPVRELRLQALRVGELGIAAIPNEVFAITGLKIKAQSPLAPTFTIELANGAEGYIPPPEQHKLGGYSTWEARSAGLEVEAEPKIVDRVLGLLETVSGKPRRQVGETHGPYARAVLDSRPAAYWRLNELAGPQAFDAAGNRQPGSYEDGIAFYLEGPQSPAFSGERTINRTAHFAGGRLRASIAQVGTTYSVELWFWNGLPSDARAVTGHIISCGAEGTTDGDHLGIGGTQSAAGRLFLSNGDKLGQHLAGKTALDTKRWYHVVLAREGTEVRVYLNGRTEPEIAGRMDAGYGSGAAVLFVGGRADDFANFEGRIDEVAVYSRALTAAEAAEHYRAARLPGNSATRE